jgi:hypothetical protein
VALTATIPCEIDGAYVVSSVTGERIVRSRWWHRMLAVFSPQFSWAFETDLLQQNAPAAFEAWAFATIKDEL